jgi:hypothetical protein
MAAAMMRSMLGILAMTAAGAFAMLMSMATTAHITAALACMLPCRRRRESARAELLQHRAQAVDWRL